MIILVIFTIFHKVLNAQITQAVQPKLNNISGKSMFVSNPPLESSKLMI